MTRLGAWGLAGALGAALLTGCARDSRTVLTIYTPHDVALRTEIEVAYEHAHPDVDVRWVELGSQGIIDRLRRERNAPVADLWFGAPADRFEVAAREGLLSPYTPTWSTQVGPAGRGRDGSWFGVFRTPLVFGYNTEAVLAANAPRRWEDLASPAWRGRIVLRDPRASGSMQTMAAAIHVRAVREQGSSASGASWLSALDANVASYAASPAALYQQLGRKDGVLTVWNLPELAALRTGSKLPVAWRVPEDGVPVVIDGIALVAGGAAPDIARDFYEFATSTPMLTRIARRLGRWPMREDIPADSLPVWARDAQQSWRVLSLDGALLADSIDAWMRPWVARIAARPTPARRRS
ncbi:MAG: extracellular solute-binding protein [Gemmatimonadaceae bacterium]|nr:extracellular solute-binding protein [Gemmatimonadaceae bacterium]